MNRQAIVAAGLILAAAGAPAAAEVTVKAPWARASVAGQKFSGAFMELTSSEDARLVAVTSPAAGLVEIHSMKMEDGIMKMRRIPVLELPAGKAVALAPGGYHIMLMDLKRPLAVGETVPLRLTVEGRDGRPAGIDVTVEVRELTAGTMPAAPKH